MTVKEMRKLLIVSGLVELECETWFECRPENIPEEYNDREVEFVEVGSVVFRLKEE